MAPNRETSEALHVGTTSTGRTVSGLILDDGTCYVLYSVANNPDVVAGVIQGDGSAMSGGFGAHTNDIDLEGLDALVAAMSANCKVTKARRGSPA